MNYEFSLNKTAVLSLIAGSIVFAFLLFIGGLVIGSYWLATESAAIHSASAKNEKDALPKEPVLAEEEAPAPKPGAPKKVVDPAAAQPKAPTAAAAPEAVSTQPNDGEIRVIQEAAADATNTAAETDPEYVTVQVGVFLDEHEANNLLKRMESRGYSPSYFSGRDAEARQWFAVRIGAYSDKQQAENAATNFTKQEKIKAVVRPIGSL
ncbi:MAG TPA: SPOR domain-containing protein [Pyrinomonadaceae bacterium]|nr:SPOR domain-containing protein [Pyrinomonadaceae bacterium]